MCCFEAVKLVLLLFLQLTSKKKPQKNMMQEPVEYFLCLYVYNINSGTMSACL